MCVFNFCNYPVQKNNNSFKMLIVNCNYRLGELVVGVLNIHNMNMAMDLRPFTFIFSNLI